MKIPFDIFGFERRKALKIDEKNQIQKIINGYPVTRTPFVPDILKHEAKFRTVIAKDGYRRVGFTLAPKGAKLVEPESLEMIRQRLLKIFNKYPKINKELETPLPRNTIAISFGNLYFELGKCCQDFVPIDLVKSSPESFFTYQQLSENIQITYYNDKGIEYLAGYCYYPVVNGKPNLWSSDGPLIHLAQTSFEPYPLQNRDTYYRKVEYNFYGRYCNKAGKRVTVDCSGVYGKICHKEFDHVSKSYNFTSCDECLDDALTYKWVDPKKNDIPAPANIYVCEQPQANPNEKFIFEFLELANQNMGRSPELNHSIPVINRDTGELLEDSKWPKLKELSSFLDTNPDYNVCTEYALIVRLSLGTEYKNRIGRDEIAPSQKSVNTLEENNVQRIRELELANSRVGGAKTFDSTISVFNRATGILLENSKCPKISELSAWLDENPDYNVHSEHHLIAHLLLKNEYEDRIGGNNDYTPVLSTSASPLPSSRLAADANVTELEIDEPSISNISSSSEEASTGNKSSKASESSGFSKTPSTASSTESLLEGYDKIEEEIMGYDNDLDVEIVN